MTVVAGPESRQPYADDPALAELARRVVSQVRREVAVRTDSVTLPELIGLVRSAAARSGVLLGMQDEITVAGLVGSQLWGLGPLQALISGPDVTDVLVNGPDEVWVDDSGGLRRVSCAIGNERELRALAVRLAAVAGRRLDEACPFVDARLFGGIRLFAVIPPVSPAGTLICLRILHRDGLDLPTIHSTGGMPRDWLPVLEALVASRAAFLISGGTGAGKTTLLSALLSRVPADERIVLVEDVGELWPRHPHVVRLEARPPNVEGQGTVDLADLVRQALRMRPDRLVVGECRGAEVRELLTALNTGHAGGCGTVHANSPEDVPARLIALGSLADLSPRAVSSQAAAGLDAVLHLERAARGRRLTAIATVGRTAAGDLTLQTALRADPDDPAAPGERGPGWVALADRLGLAQADAPGSPRT